MRTYPYTHRWDVASRAYRRAHPFCVVCRRPAKVVDHIRPHRGDLRLFWDRRNWQSLCKLHHDRKTATRDGGFGNHHDQRVSPNA